MNFDLETPATTGPKSVSTEAWLAMALSLVVTPGHLDRGSIT